MSNLTQEVKNIWAKRQTEVKGLDAIKRDDDKLLLELTKEKILQRKQAIRHDINLEINKIYQNIKIVTENNENAPLELKKLMELNKNGFSKKQKKFLGMLQGSLEAISFSIPDFLDRSSNLGEAKAKLFEITHILNKRFNKILKSQFWGFKKELQKIYTKKLQIKVKDYINVHQSKTTQKLNIAKQNPFHTKLIEFINQNSPSSKKQAKIFIKIIKKNSALIDSLVDPQAYNSRKNETIMNFLCLLTKNNLLRYFKNKTEKMRKESETTASSITSIIMNSYSLKSNTQLPNLTRLARTLFNEDSGKFIKAELRTLIATYTIYMHLIEMLSKSSANEREQVFSKLMETISDNESEQVWDEFFLKRPSLNNVKVYRNSNTPVTHSIIWALRDSLQNEGHPIFLGLNDRVNALYVSQGQLARINKQNQNTLSTAKHHVMKYSGTLFNSMPRQTSQTASSNLQPETENATVVFLK